MDKKICSNCYRKLEDGTREGHRYDCTNCGTSICEECQRFLTQYRKNPSPDESNCLGALCPGCKELHHFEEL
jgi:predicted RNA-binding Zn-ribbon protein involved in translation (DUF1610 family)